MCVRIVGDSAGGSTTVQTTIVIGHVWHGDTSWGHMEWNMGIQGMGHGEWDMGM